MRTMRDGFDIPGRDLAMISQADLAGRHRCKVCGEAFLTLPGYAYRFDHKGHTLWFCRYNHMRQYQRVIEAEKQRKTEEYIRQSGKERSFARIWKQTPEACRRRIRECRETLAQKQAEYDISTDSYRRMALRKLIRMWQDKVKEAEECLVELEG